MYGWTASRRRPPRTRRLVYVYFGDKGRLFNTVLVRHLEAMFDGVPFDVDDLPTYAANLFDYLDQRPTFLRLFNWCNLERPEASSASDVEQASYRDKIASIIEAQQDGRIAPDMPGAHLLAAILALVLSGAGLPGAAPRSQRDGRRGGREDK